jgi:hypothetical protein
MQRTAEDRAREEECSRFYCQQATRAFIRGDVGQFLLTRCDTRALGVVKLNIAPLQEIGKYEEALVRAWVDSRTNHSHYRMEDVRYLLKIADRSRLRECSDPIPEQEQFTLYRGCAGKGAAKRKRGFSWTSNLETAKWFAKRLVPYLKDPAVYRVVASKDDILFHTKARNESEYVVLLPKKTHLECVWKGTDADCVFEEWDEAENETANTMDSSAA